MTMFCSDWSVREHHVNYTSAVIDRFISYTIYHDQITILKD